MSREEDRIMADKLFRNWLRKEFKAEVQRFNQETGARLPLTDRGLTRIVALKNMRNKENDGKKKKFLPDIMDIL